MARLLAFIFGLACYALMFAALLYLLGFLANAFVPKGIDSGARVPLPEALLIDSGLLLLFGLQHSVMARPGFKQWWKRLVPDSIERSTYVLLASGVLVLLFVCWQPLPQVIWSAGTTWVTGGAWSIFLLGVLLLLAATFVIDHFDLFGLRQVWLNLIGRPYVPPGFRVAWFYKYLRHPIYLGWLLIFWATPHMTLGHLLFALGMSAYIFIGVHYEERDLVKIHGPDYREYQRRVPMLIPRPTRGSAGKPSWSTPGGSR